MLCFLLWKGWRYKVDKDVKKMKKAVCPYCGMPVNVFLEKDAKCKGIFFKCKNKKTCGKQFELKL